MTTEYNCTESVQILRCHLLYWNLFAPSLSIIKFKETDNAIKSCYITNSSWKPINLFLLKNVSDRHVFHLEFNKIVILYKSHLLIHATEKMTEIDRIDLI